MPKTGQFGSFDGFRLVRLLEIERNWPAKEFLLIGCYLGIPPMCPIAGRLCHASGLRGAWVGLQGCREGGQWIVLWADGVGGGGGGWGQNRPPGFHRYLPLSIPRPYSDDFPSKTV